MAEPITMPRAAFIISIDTEMSWGVIHRPERTYEYERERADMRRLLDMFDGHSIPATWAVVGHLFLESCEPVDGVKHPEIVRPDYDWFTGDWFDADPCSSLTESPSWYCPDLVDDIRSRPAGHEIGSHGFSHMITDDPGCSDETWTSELEASADAAAARNVDLRSFIHPRNRIGHVDALIEHGFTSYRGRRPASAQQPGRLESLRDFLVGSERTIVRPQWENGIWNFPATCMFDIAAKRPVQRLWIHQMLRRLDQAVEARSLFHLWFHPHNIGDDVELALWGLERLCARAAGHRDAGQLDTLTMGDLSAELTKVYSSQENDVRRVVVDPDRGYLGGTERANEPDG